MYPEDGPLNKADGRMVEGSFGPITSWHVTYSSSGPSIVACTAKAKYLLSKPAQPYKKVHAALEEQANVTWHVLQVRNPWVVEAALYYQLSLLALTW